VRLIGWLVDYLQEGQLDWVLLEQGSKAFLQSRQDSEGNPVKARQCQGSSGS